MGIHLPEEIGQVPNSHKEDGRDENDHEWIGCWSDHGNLPDGTSNFLFLVPSLLYLLYHMNNMSLIMIFFCFK